MLRPAAPGFPNAFNLSLVAGGSTIRDACIVLLFAAALVFGGGTKQGLWSDALIEIAALPVLAWTITSIKWRELDKPARYGFSLAAVVLLVLCLQLLPLPPWLWHLLPGRSQIAQELSLVGLDQSWQPVTLAPRECRLALLALIPAMTLFVATVQLPANQRRALMLIFLIWVCVDAVLSFLQTASGPESALRFYAQTNLDRAVGFFANSNHNALALSLAAPFLVFSAFGRDGERVKTAGALLAASALAAVVVAVTLTRSRAGIGLLLVGVTVSAVIILLRTRERRDRKRYIVFGLAFAALVALASVQTGFLGISARLESPVGEDLRWALLNVSYDAILNFLPTGSGLGSFVPVYERFAPLSLVHLAYVNHAHNDWVELLLELGLLWPLMVLVFVLWAGFAVLQRYRKHGRMVFNELLPCLIGLLLMAGASAVDYPLRTIALLSAFGALCGALVEPPQAAFRNLGRG